MRDFVLLYINGQRTEVRGPAAFAPLSDFLRYDLGKTGTKVVCAEGDCGACAVLVGRPAPGDQLVYQPITSCIARVYQLDGAHVITVEGLKYDRGLNPVQRAMVDGHGVQCGFCTPGFVVSLCGLLENKPVADDADRRAALVGNLCRCTGYQAILDAAARVDVSTVRRLNDLYPPGPMLAELRGRVGDEASIESPGRRFFKPSTVERAVRFKAANPTCTLIAGGTDLGVLMNRGARDCDVVMSLAAVGELNGIEVTDDQLVVRANATLAELEGATRTALPAVHGMLTRHGSPLIRNAATLAGNIANGSSIGDALPALLVLNAQIELAGIEPGSDAGVVRRRVDANDFYTGYRKNVMRPDELITAVTLPLPGDGEVLRLYKVSKRFDVDISTFTAAIWARLDGDAIRNIRIAYGGVASIVLRLPRTESYLCGKVLGASAFQHAGRLARGEIGPISDVRGSADYRSQLAENVLQKFYLDVSSVLGPPGARAVSAIP